MKKWFAVIGDPIHQSMSPFMHDQWFLENNLNQTYLPLHLKSAELQQGINSLKLLNCKGWNVTVPHKTAILPLLDEIDETAREMNAVNTVEVLSDGKLRGSNTDGPGFVRSLEEQFGIAHRNKAVLVIGAGGAAKGICFSLNKAGYGPITIANRTVDKAKQIAAEIENAVAITIKEAEKKIDSFSIIVQTTSVGMSFADEGMPLQLKNIEENTIVADIIYNPIETPFLKVAREQGAKTMNGVGMFVHQGALSFEKWTGIQPNTKEMIKTITKKLGGTYVNR